MKKAPPVRVQFLASTKGDIHTVPTRWGGPEHRSSSKCFCNPEPYFVDLVSGRAAWLHKRPS